MNPAHGLTELAKVSAVGLGGAFTSFKLALVNSDPDWVIKYAPSAIVALLTSIYICAKIYFLFKNKGKSPD